MIVVLNKTFFYHSPFKLPSLFQIDVQISVEGLQFSEALLPEIF